MYFRVNNLIIIKVLLCFIIITLPEEVDTGLGYFILRRKGLQDKVASLNKYMFGNSTKCENVAVSAALITYQYNMFNITFVDLVVCQGVSSCWNKNLHIHGVETLADNRAS